MGNHLILALATATVLSGVLLKGDTPYVLSVPSDALTLEYENENVICDSAARRHARRTRGLREQILPSETMTRPSRIFVSHFIPTLSHEKFLTTPGRLLARRWNRRRPAGRHCAIVSATPDPEGRRGGVADGFRGPAARVPVRYAAAEYFQTEGDGIACGYVYRGTLAPELQGACIFGDITTGRLFYCNLAEMIAADDTNPATLAAIHELQVVFDSPTDIPNQGATQRRMFDIVRDEYHRKGGTAPSLPGSAATTGGSDSDGVPYGGGRADIRVAQAGDGELYVLSKSDGCIRQLTSVTLPLHVGVSATSSKAAWLTWNSIPGWLYRLQCRTNLADAPWVDVMAELRATETKTTTPIPLDADSQCFYRVQRRHP